MPLLTPSNVHIDAPLSNLTLAYVQEQTNFVADKVFPVVGVQRQSDKYYVYDRANMNRSGDVKKLAPRTEVNRIGLQLSNDSYFADVYGLGMDFDEQTLANEDAVLEIRAAGAQTLVNRVLIEREEQFASSFFSAGIWGTDATPSNLWSDYTNSTPRFIDDDNIASYVFSKDSDTAFVTSNTDTSTSSNQIIAGSRGTILEFSFQSSLELNTSTQLFTELGSTEVASSTMSLQAASYYIDTNVTVIGLTTGYRVDLPVRFLKKQ